MRQRVTKRFFSWAFVFCMVFALIPNVTALANPTDGGNYLTFTSTGDSTVVANYLTGTNVMYKKSTDSDWQECPNTTSGTIISLKDGESVQFKGNGIKTNSGNHFTITGNVYASGNITSLINEVGGDCELPNGTFDFFFGGSTGLVGVSEDLLPATVASLGSYGSMFRDCTNLISAPNLPATVVGASGYKSMFMGCTNLVNVPNLPATVVGTSGYESMFEGCTSLVTVPDLNVTVFPEGSSINCKRMFFGCTKLEKAPALPATVLAQSCYESMFYKCTSLKATPVLKAPKTALGSYLAMFSGCKELKEITVLATDFSGSFWNNYMFEGISNISEDFKFYIDKDYYEEYVKGKVTSSIVGLGIYAGFDSKEIKTKVIGNTYPYEETIEHICNADLEEGKAATCTEDGWKDYYKCTNLKCGKLYTDSTLSEEIEDFDSWKITDNEGKVPALGHKKDTTKYHGAVAATCVATGEKEYWECARDNCDVKLDKSTNVIDDITIEMDLNAHKGGVATCQIKAVCTLCGASYGDFAGHVYSDEFTIDKEVTCTSYGSKSKHCTVEGCNAKTKITQIVPAGHRGGTATCKTLAVCSVCGKSYGSLAGHTYEEEFTVDKEPTCTQKGSKSKHCKTLGCTYKLDMTEIEALGHKGGTATCQEKAKCEVCGEAYGNFGDHDFSDNAEVCRNEGCTEKNPNYVAPEKEEEKDKDSETDKDTQKDPDASKDQDVQKDPEVNKDKEPQKKPEPQRDTEPQKKPESKPENKPESKPETQGAKPVTVTYSTHLKILGDSQGEKKNGEVAGTTGESRRMEAIRIKVSGNENLGIAYTTHVKSIGWLPWSTNNEVSGTTGESRRMEAIKIQLRGKDANKYDVYYRVHVETYGWMNWAKNGEIAGTTGIYKRLEAIQIVVVEKGKSVDSKLGGIKSNDTKTYFSGNTKPVEPVVYDSTKPNVLYRTNIQTIGWQNWKSNGVVSGTTGVAKKINGVSIKLTNCDYAGGIQYKTHVQSLGWEKAWKTNGAVSGVSGENKRLEAIKIELTGEMANKYDVYYRVHVESYGWMAWAKNGEAAGTENMSKRLEGMQIVLVEKGGKAPAINYGGVSSSTNKTFIKK